MWELITHPSNYAFSISLSLMFMLGILELMLLIAGGGSQGLLDQFLPDDLSTSPQHADTGMDGSPNLFIQLLDWLYIGRVPLLIWLIIFLTIYGLTGLIAQTVFYQFTSHYFSAWIIAPACLFICMPLVRYSSMLIAKILPKDETTAIFSEELIGRTAVIILGEAKQHSPAQARVKDQFGQVHYILVEPENDEIFSQGQSVILSEKTSIGFLAVSV
jgi:hypothetical protein